MTKARIWFLAVTAALGGFLFGFDTIVINGAEQDIQALWNLSGTVHGWVVSSALWGTVLGSLGGGWVSDRWGRKRTLVAVGVLFFVSAVWSACATGPWTLIAARFVGGLGVGVSTIAAPVYIAEIAPAASRGRMTALFQFNIVFGVLASLASNLALKGVGPNAWRWMLGVEAVPALAFPVAAESVPAWAIFAFFGTMMVFHFAWAYLFVPETKGTRLALGHNNNLIPQQQATARENATMKQTKRTQVLIAVLGVAAAGISVGGEPERAALERVPSRTVAAYTSASKTLMAARGWAVSCTNERRVRFVARGGIFVIR